MIRHRSARVAGSTPRGRWPAMTAAVLALAAAGAGCANPPAFTTTTLVSGLSVPWDLAFTPDGALLFTERPGWIDVRLSSGVVRQLASPADVKTGSEAGMMGLVVDPQFATNRYVYTCLASTLGGPNGDVRVARWTVDAGYTTLSSRTDIVTGIPVNTLGESGRHSGCRPRFGPDGYLYIGTGDSAVGTVPQDPHSLGGKILRVTRDGAAAPGNLGGAYDARIFSTGHRNTQGLAWRPSDRLGISVEHGPDVNDEVNLLVEGNFGWDPVYPGGGNAYNEAVPMTDLTKFPTAVRALWSSGSYTLATSGATFLTGTQWKAWNGVLIVACLKGSRLLALPMNGQGKVTDIGAGLINTYGRLRTPV